MSDTMNATPGVSARLAWRRWRRGGGTYATHPQVAGQLYSIMPIKRPSGRNSGAYEVTDFCWRSGRRQRVADAAAARVLAQEWFDAGPADDGHARLRAAWGSWHEQVPDGSVGVAVLLPGTGELAHRLIDVAVYRAARADEEGRVPVADLREGFDLDATSKQVQLAG